MANIVRRMENLPSAFASFDPFQVMRELMSWDPTAALLGQEEPRTFMPRFEVKETPERYVFKADLPGVKEDDLNVTVTGNRITVAGKREEEKREEGETWYAYERAFGSFTRSFTLPEGADLDQVEADLSNGVLTLSVPKRPEEQPRRVTLKNLAEKVKGALGGEKGKA